MIFEALAIQNFLSIKKIDLKLKDMGLVLLNGKNMDNPSLNNNGAGKSSILEAIVYALYGRTLRGLKGDAVVNNTVGRNTKVFLNLTDDDGTPYRIARYRKHSTNKSKVFLYRNGRDITPKSESDVETYITNLLQADYSTFTSSLLYSAESFKFTTATDSEIKKTFDTMLDLDRLTKCCSVVRRKLAVLDTKLGGLLDNKADLEGDIQDYYDQIEAQTEKLDQWKSAQESKAQTISEDLKSRTDKGIELKEELQSMVDEVESLESDMQDIQQLIEHRNETLKQLEKVGEELSDTNAQIKETELSIKGCNFAIKNNDEYIAQRETEINNLNHKIDIQKGQIESIKSQIGQPCPTCGKPLDARSVESAVQGYKDQVSECIAQIERISEEISAKSAQSDNLRQQMKGYGETLEELNQTKHRLEKTVDKAGSIEESKGKLEKQLSKAEKFHHSMELDIASKRSDIKFNSQRITQLEEDLKAVHKETNPYISIVQTLKDKCEKYQEDIKSMVVEIEGLQSKKECLEFWNIAYSNQGIKSFILDDITPFLNRRVNKYLSKLTSNQIEVVFSTQSTLKTGEMREKFSIEVTNHSGGTTYPSNSGGEKKRIDLAINLALQDLVASRSSKKINIAIFDEVFDALDENGIDGVVSLLQELAQSKSTILVVSHNEYLKSYFTNVLTVVKHNGCSSLQKSIESDIVDE